MQTYPVEPLYSGYHWFSKKMSAIERFQCTILCYTLIFSVIVLCSLVQCCIVLHCVNFVVLCSTVLQRV